MNTNHQSPITNHHDEINPLDYWRVVKKHRKMIVIILAVTSVVAVIISLLLPKTYRAEAVIIPVSSRGGGMSSLASQFGGLASLAGISVPGVADDASKFVTILQSRTLTENVINRENLMPLLFEEAWDAKAGKWKSDDPKNQPNMESAVNNMKLAVTVMDDKRSKTIKISGVFRDRDLAARVVNAYLGELQKFINENAFTMAKRNRIFIEGQLEENKEGLLEAGKEINEFYSGKRISSSDAKVDVPIAMISEPPTNHPSPITNHEDTNANSQTTVTESRIRNPVISTAEASTLLIDPEISNLMTQKADVEKKIVEAKIVKNVPQQVYLTYLMLRRELLAKVNAMLTSQYEMAKIEESKEDLAFQVVDKAVPPLERFSPRRKHICVMSFMAALFAGVFIAFFREYINRMKKMQNTV